MNQMTIAEVLNAPAAPAGKTTVGGWVRTVRLSKGGFAFIAINDGSSFDNLQIVAKAELPNYSSELARLTAGCSILAEGSIVESPGSGQRFEMQAEEIRILGWADPAGYPIQPKHHTYEFLRTQAHLRARTNTFGAVARVRNAMSLAIHGFFQSRGFLYVHTPIITASDCEGAGQMFRVTTLPVGGGALPAEEDFFGRPTFLTVSGQMEAETYACGLGKVYTFGPTFRAENSNTARHLAEFWMVEPEMAFCDLAGDADLAEAFVKHIFSAVLTGCPRDMAFFDERVEKGVVATLEHIVASPFERITYTQAVEILEKSGQKFDYPVSWGSDLQSEHERYLTEKHIGRPVIVTDYPRQIKAFYMRLNDDAKTVAAMDVLVPRIGEIIGGSQREERLDVLTARMAEGGLKPESYWWYADLRRYGTVPHAGFGLGLERTIQFATGMANIRDVIPYPRTPRSAEF
jgi:asparaginyl-tRNA synthetase